METVIKKPHYAWWILASCIAFYSSTMGVLVNTQGIFMPPMLKDLGWSATQYSTAGIVSGLVSVLTLTFVDKIYKKFSIKPVLLASVFIYELGFMLKTFTHSYFYYCAIMVLIGVGGAFVLYVPVPMLINAWFDKKRGFALGLALLSSGAAGAILNPIISPIIENSGWRIAIVITAAIAMIISLPFLIFVVKGKPEDMGVLPYGASRKSDTSEINLEHGKEAQAIFNSRFSKSEKKKKLTICIIMAALLNITSVVSSHMANFAASLGLAATIGATLTSAVMVGNLSSKAILGTCMDRYGKYKALLVSMSLVVVGFLLLGINEKVIALMYVAALILGLTAAHNTMVMPALVGTYAIGDEYTKFISKVSMGTMIASAFSNTITSGIYDLTGLYQAVWFLYAGLQLICIVLLIGFNKIRKKY